GPARMVVLQRFLELHGVIGNCLDPVELRSDVFTKPDHDELAYGKSRIAGELEFGRAALDGRCQGAACVRSRWRIRLQVAILIARHAVGSRDDRVAARGVVRSAEVTGSGRAEIDHRSCTAAIAFARPDFTNAVVRQGRSRHCEGALMCSPRPRERELLWVAVA